MTNDWSVNIDNGLLNGVVFIDLTKAFDAIDDEMILRKMSFLGFDRVAEPKDVMSTHAINCSRSQVRRTAGKYTGSFSISNLY